MALLTAEDVFNKKFQPTRLREGYDQDEVDDFLDEVVNTLRVVTNENEELRQKLAAAERRVAELTRAGAARQQAAPVPTPQPAPAPTPAPPAAPPQLGRPQEPESATGMLALAQKLHDDYVHSGQEEHDRIVADAKTQAARYIREAETQRDQTLSQLENERALLERKIDELRVFERDYRTRLKSYLEGLLTDLDGKTPASAAGGRGQVSQRDSGGFQYGG